MLCGLRISGWSARKLDRKVTDETNHAHGAASDAGRYNKALLAKDALAAVVTAANAARTFHYARTLPWLDDGARILPAAAYADFAPAFAWVAEHVPDAAAVIYLTDCDSRDYGPEPAVPVIWAATEEPRDVPPFGELIRIDPHA